MKTVAVAVLVIISLFAATASAQQAPQKISSAQLPRPIDQTAADWVADALDSNGFADMARRIDKTQDSLRTVVNNLAVPVEQVTKVVRMPYMGDGAYTLRALAEAAKDFAYQRAYDAAVAECDSLGWDSEDVTARGKTNAWKKYIKKRRTKLGRQEAAHAFVAELTKVRGNDDTDNTVVGINLDRLSKVEERLDGLTKNLHESVKLMVNFADNGDRGVLGREARELLNRIRVDDE